MTCACCSSIIEAHRVDGPYTETDSAYRYRLFFRCHHCGQGYYGELDLSDFRPDPEEPGKKGSEVVG